MGESIRVVRTAGLARAEPRVVEDGRGPAAARYRWEVREQQPNEYLASFAPAHPLLIQLLFNRGVSQPEDVRAFLDGPKAPLHSPWLMRGMDLAAERVLRARANGETIAVYGDYDADGVTSTAILTECLELLGIEAIPFVPRRDVDGYGLNADAIDRLRAAGASLIVSIDCGISGAAEVAHARAHGVDVVVVDHHHVPPTLPDAAAVVNPKQDGCTYPFKELCAVGLAYKVATALLDKAGFAPDEADRWLDLVALGTVADVVPLLGENRALVMRGLPALNRLVRPGLRALAYRAAIPENRITGATIGYVLAPRLNAAGRLGDASESLRLLLTRSPEEAKQIAERLELTNRDRQRRTDEAVELARAALGPKWDEDPRRFPKLVVVASEEYHQGVVGLVAGRLVEEFCRPAVAVELRDGVAHGSARSIEGFHITEALARCQDLLRTYGGHELAAGFSLDPDNLGALQERLEEIAVAEIDDARLLPRLKIDARLHLRRWDPARLDALLQALEPHGAGNPVPTFTSAGLAVVERGRFGRERQDHLKLTLADGPTRWKAVGFGMANRLDHLGPRVDLAYQVERDDWNGGTGIRLRLADLCPSVQET
jgi:single-stranded-DNA-specific exonuclease